MEIFNSLLNVEQITIILQIKMQNHNEIFLRIMPILDWISVLFAIKEVNACMIVVMLLSLTFFTARLMLDRRRRGFNASFDWTKGRSHWDLQSKFKRWIVFLLNKFWKNRKILINYQRYLSLAKPIMIKPMVYKDDERAKECN